MQQVQRERSFCHRSRRGCSEHGAAHRTRRAASACGREAIDNDDDDGDDDDDDNNDNDIDMLISHDRR